MQQYDNMLAQIKKPKNFVIVSVKDSNRYPVNYEIKLKVQNLNRRNSLLHSIGFQRVYEVNSANVPAIMTQLKTVLHIFDIKKHKKNYVHIFVYTLDSAHCN